MEILSFNEWKESDNYILDTFFQKINKESKTWFDNNEELEYDDFEFDSNDIASIYVSTLTFHETDVQYKLNIIVDSEILDDQTIEKIDIELFAYSINDQSEIGSVKKNINPEDLNYDMLLQLINEIKK